MVRINCTSRYTSSMCKIGNYGIVSYMQEDTSFIGVLLLCKDAYENEKMDLYSYPFHLDELIELDIVTQMEVCGLYPECVSKAESFLKGEGDKK